MKVTPLVKGIMTGVDSIENYKGVDDAEEEEEELAMGQLQQPLLPDQLPQRPEQQQPVPPLQQMPTGPAPVQNGPVQQRVVNSNSTPMDAVVVVASRQTRRGRAVVPALIPKETYLCACSKNASVGNSSSQVAIWRDAILAKCAKLKRCTSISTTSVFIASLTKR